MVTCLKQGTVILSAYDLAYRKKPAFAGHVTFVFIYEHSYKEELSLMTRVPIRSVPNDNYWIKLFFNV